MFVPVVGVISDLHVPPAARIRIPFRSAPATASRVVERMVCQRISTRAIAPAARTSDAEACNSGLQINA